MMSITEKGSFEHRAQVAWDQYTIDNEEKFSKIDDERFFMLGDVFFDGYMKAIGDIYGL